MLIADQHLSISLVATSSDTIHLSTGLGGSFGLSTPKPSFHRIPPDIWRANGGAKLRGGFA
jgi:hypothetical protein